MDIAFRTEPMNIKAGYLFIACVLLAARLFAQDSAEQAYNDTVQIDEITIAAQKMKLVRMKSVEGTVIYEGKKTEIIDLSSINANLATNNGRQIFSRIAGLNVWESDVSGMQLGIGARGLNPNRSAEFNIRQNGYDITADAIGYPDAYFTPPTEGLDRIDVVRGAASLQFGTQFGGLINFRTHVPVQKKFQFTTQNTGGSFGLVSSFNAIEGTKGKFSYYAYYQFKHANGWRKNSTLNAHSAFAFIEYNATKKFTISAEFTHQNYLMQQPGGLTDKQFEADPRQSTRTRNWFSINWNIPSLKLEYHPTAGVTWNTVFFGLIGSRKALGFLSFANRADDFRERDLILDSYGNFGVESRVLIRYKLLKNESSLSVGMRYFNGHTTKKQGRGTSGDDADFDYLNPDDLENSDYTFPSHNFALSAENIFKITSKFSITPGVRMEFIYTKSDGYYKNTRDGLYEVLDSTKYMDGKLRKRIFPLFGVGLAYKAHPLAEVYANISQNYRGINFTDLRIVNPNVRVDPNLQDEKGFNGDVGVRGKLGEKVNYDINFFSLYYNKKIGAIQQFDSAFTIYRYKTNISNSRSLGIESFIEFDIIKIIREQSDFGLSFFSNFTYTNSKYIKSANRQIEGKKVEFSPAYIFRGGTTFKYKTFSLSYQISSISEQFTDATNATYASTAVIGSIPKYRVMDLSASYSYKFVKASFTINNMANAVYFTRRAESYPGPGIIPSDGIAFYGTVAFKIGTKN
jgi:Fe(3+) dicitrate transport protein